MSLVQKYFDGTLNTTPYSDFDFRTPTDEELEDIKRGLILYEKWYLRERKEDVKIYIILFTFCVFLTLFFTIFSFISDDVFAIIVMLIFDVLYAIIYPIPFIRIFIKKKEVTKNIAEILKNNSIKICNCEYREWVPRMDVGTRLIIFQSVSTDFIGLFEVPCEFAKGVDLYLVQTMYYNECTEMNEYKYCVLTKYMLEETEKVEKEIA